MIYPRTVAIAAFVTLALAATEVPAAPEPTPVSESPPPTRAFLCALDGQRDGDAH